RDWKTLTMAVAGNQQIKLTILSSSAPKHLAQDAININIRAAKNNDEFFDELNNADIVCVPLKPNLHASGITVIQEAVLSGIPVIATNTGGLNLYFSEDEIAYVPAGDAFALQAALQDLLQNPAAARKRAIAAQARMADAENYGAQAYIARHVAISQNLLKK
ncbi:MAG: glycosyltransferase, partial [Rhodospirillales bacterium]|nr:glycosyltransferase [Rhodospirillales bacterium]